MPNQADLNIDDIQIGTIDVMKTRELNQHEAQYLAKRDWIHAFRKIVEKVIYMMPSILAAIAGLMEVYVNGH